MQRGSKVDSFTSFMVETEPRVRRALIAGYGAQLGYDATLEAFEYAWEHWARILHTRNPAGYVYRVGANCAARKRRGDKPTVVLSDVDASDPSSMPWIEPKLGAAMGQLSDQQRMAVILIHGFGCTYQEVSDLLSVRRSTVQKHVERGLAKLRIDLGAHDAVV